MKEIKYKTKDGEEKIAYKLENGDKIVPEHDKPVKYGEVHENFGIEAQVEDLGKVFVILTKTQAKQVEEKGNVKGVELETEEYSNKYGTHVGFIK